jgi:hypothetical protein
VPKRDSCGAVGDGRPQGRAPPDHLHAVRPGALPGERKSAGGTAAVRAHGHRPAHGFHSQRGPDSDQRNEFLSLLKELVEDEGRNRLICDDVIRAVREGRSPLVLDRTQSAPGASRRSTLRKCPPLGRAAWWYGQEGNRGRSRAASADSPEEERVLLATGKYIGEGFDDPRLDTLFVTLPISWRGTVAQYVGRLHRLHDAKREVQVYDYADLDVPMLSRMFDRRCRGYEAVGYTIVLPAGAIPGWPADVPLPVDPAWKRDYAASVRRLVRDGVESSLATLFVDVARPLPPDAEGLDRARSAAEAFLYRRLQTLAVTAGHFRLERAPVDPIRWIEWHGGRSPMRQAACGDRTRWSATPRRSCRLPPRPSQGPTVAGERLYRPALPHRRCREGSGRRCWMIMPACFLPRIRSWHGNERRPPLRRASAQAMTLSVSTSRTATLSSAVARASSSLTSLCRVPSLPSETDTIAAIGARSRTVRQDFAVSRIDTQVAIRGERHQDEVAVEGLHPLKRL